jgi:hypothetical protein
MGKKTISVVAGARGEEEIDLTDRGIIDDVQNFFARRVELSTKDLALRLQNFLGAMDEIVGQLPATLGGFDLKEMTLSVEISAKGQVSLLGTGGEIGTTGGLTFTLKRS